MQIVLHEMSYPILSEQYYKILSAEFFIQHEHAKSNWNKSHWSGQQ